jgi:general secretion pathway protein E
MGTIPGATDLSKARILSDAFSAEYLEQHAVLPLEIVDGTLIVASWLERPDAQALSDLQRILGGEPRVHLTAEAPVREAIRRVYGAENQTAEQLIATLEPVDGSAAEITVGPAMDDLRAMANEAPVVRLVNLLLIEALEARASDVHLKNSSAGMRVRYRIDGVLQEAPSPPPHLKAAVVSRLKIMADLDIAERRLPQDGRIQLRLKNRSVDLRVSTVPTLHGESVVLRLLDRTTARIGLNDIGMAEDTLAAFTDVLARPHGMVLVTGPTGSGKTTTLYAAVDHVDSGKENILTVEDPVEYELPSANQVPIQPKIGLTFASALRALLRQDPDVLLIGEVRDGETAQIAVQAALTGHLVLTTLHTNDALSALTRLLDLGVPDYLILNTVEAVVAQRLVRKNCTKCVVSVQDKSWAGAFGLHTEDTPSYQRGTGCGHCRGTGFYGRTGVYEFFRLSESFRDAIRSDQHFSRLHEHARAAGLRSLREDGLRLVLAGVTTPEEVIRVTV